jgi:hypothetical protein
MARIGNPRQPMGQSGFSFNDPSGEPSPNTTPVAKKSGKTADPTNPGSKANRKAVMYDLPAGRGDRNGARYRISEKFPPHSSPEAGATQAHGRIIGSATGQSGNFAQERSISDNA